MTHNHRRSQTWISLLFTVFIVASLLLAVSPARSVSAGTNILGAYDRVGDLKIQVLDDGRIGVERKTSSTWERQVYAVTNKGSRLQFSGGSLGLGYFSGGSKTTVYNTLTNDGGPSGSRTWTNNTKWNGSGFDILQTVTYRDGDPYFKLQWLITNVSGSGKSDLRFLHGEDTYLRGGDNGAGWVDWGNSTIGVKKNVGAEGEQRMSLQGITTAQAYQSNNYYSSYQAVNAGSLSNTIDPNEGTDNGYALQWNNATLNNGASWTITAYEKFNVSAIGSVQVIAPVAEDCASGSTCNLSYTVKNPGGSALNVALSVTTALNSWGYTVTWPSGNSSPTIPAGGSVPVIVAVTVPGSAANGASMNVTLKAHPASGSDSSETAAVNAVAPANRNPSSVSLGWSSPAYSRSFNERNGANQVLATLSGSDPDGDSLTYSLSGTDASSFNLSGNSLRNNTSFNYEAKTSYSINVVASDGKGGLYSQPVSISVDNVLEAPTLAAPGNQTTNEDTPLTVGMTATDPDNTTSRLNWSLLSGPSQGAVSGATGAGGSKSITYSPNPDTFGTDNFTIRVTGEGGTTSNQTVQVIVNAVNDAPTNQWNGTGAFGGPLNVRVGQAITFDDVSETHNANRIEVADVDANNLQVTLTVSKGILALSGWTGLSGDTNAGGPDSSLSFQGSKTAVNAALKGLQYTPNTNVGSGAGGENDTLTILTSDQGNTGLGGAKTDQDTLSLHIENPATLKVDDGNRPYSVPDWGYTNFTRIEDAIAAAQGISSAVTVEVYAGSYPADSIVINQSNLTFALKGDVSLGNDFTLQQGSFASNAYPFTFVTGTGNRTSHTLSGAPTFANLTVANGNTLVLANGADLGLTGSLALNGSGALNATTSGSRTTVSLKAPGSPTLPAGLTLDNLNVGAGVSFNAPATLTLLGNLSNGGVYTGGSSTITFAGPGGRTQAISGTAPQFNQVVIASGATVQPATDLSVNADWTNSGSFNGGGNTVTFNGLPTRFYGTTVFSNVVVPSGASLVLDPGSDFGYTGTFDNQGAFDPAANGATLRLAGTGVQTLPTGADQYHHLVIGPAATLNANGRNLAVNGDLTVSGGLAQTSGSFTFATFPTHALHITGSVPQFGSLTINTGGTLTPDAGKEFRVKGDWNNQGSFNPNGGLVTFNGATQTFTNSTVFKDVKIDSTNPLILANGADFGFSGALTGSQTLDARANSNTTVRIAGASGTQTLPAALDNLHNLAVNSGATLSLLGRNLSLRGNLTNLGTLDQTGGELRFDTGTSHTLQTGAQSSTQLGSLQIAGGNTLSSVCDPAKPLLVNGDWNQSGDFSANQCNLTFNGTGKQDITGSGIHFYDLTVNNTAIFPNDDTDVNTVSPIEVTHTLQVLKGQFQPKGSSIFKDVVLGSNANTEDGILRPNTGETLYVSGNWERKAYGWFDANSGTVEFDGSVNATIQGGTTFYKMTAAKATGIILDSNAPVIVENQLTAKSGVFQPSANSKFKHIDIKSGSTLRPAGNINISGDLDNSLGGAYDSNAKSVTFDGSAAPQKLSGRVDFYNLTVNQGATLEMQPNSILGYKGALVLKGTLDATTHPHNTIKIMGQNLAQPQLLSDPIAPVTVNDLTVDGGSSLKLSGNLTVTGNMSVAGAFDANGKTVSFTRAGGDDPTFSGTAAFGTVAINPAATLFLENGAAFTLSGSMTGGAFDGVSHTAATPSTLLISGAGVTLPTGAKIANLGIATGASLNGAATNLNVYGNWTYDGGTFVPGNGTVTFKGAGNQAINGGTQTFNHLVIDNTGNPDHTVTAGTVTTSSSLDVSNGVFRPACGSVFAAVDLSGGELLLPDSPACTAGTGITVQGNWTKTGGAFTHNNGTVIFNGSGPHTLSGDTTLAGLRVVDNQPLALQSGANLHLSGPATFTGASTLVGNAGSTLTVTGTLTLPTGAQLGNLVVDSGASLTADSLTVQGNLTQNGGTLTAPTALTIAGNLTQGGGILTAPGTLTLGGDLTHTGGTIDNRGGSVTFDGNLTHIVSTTATDAVKFGSLTIPSGETLNQTNGEIRVGGNWANQGTYTPNTSKVVFNGTDDQQIQTIDAAGGNLFYDLSIDNTKTNPQLGVVTSLDQASDPVKLIVTHDLEILHGKLDLPTGSTLSNVHVAEGAVIGLPAGADSVQVTGNWANAGTMTLAGGQTAAEVVDGPAYLSTSIVDQSLAGAPGVGFDKFTTIGAALPATQNNVIVYGGSSGFVTYAETINLNDAAKTLTIHGKTTIDDLTLTDGTIQFADQAELHPTTFAQTGGAINLGNGSLIITGNFAPSGGILNSGTSKLSLTGDFNPSGYTFNIQTGTVEFNGSAPQSISSGTSFYNLKINNTAAPNDTDAVVPLGAITVAHNLDVVDGQFMPYDETQVKTVTIGANGILKLAAWADLNFAAGGSLTNSGMLDLNGGRINGLPQGSLWVDDNYSSATSGFGYDTFATVASAFSSPNSVLATGTVHVKNGSYADTTINQSGWTVSIDDINSGTADFTSSLTVSNGTLAVANGKTLKLSDSLTLASTSSFTPNTGTVELNGSTAQTISGPAGVTFYNLTINNSGSSPVTTTATILSNGSLLVKDGIFQPACGSSFTNVTVKDGAELRLADSSCAINVSGDWTVESSGTFNPNGGKVVFNGPDVKIIGNASFASIEIASGQLTAPLTGTLTVGGDWTNHGTFAPNGATVAFGTGSHALTGETLLFHSISIAGGGTLTPAANLELTGNWTQADSSGFVPGNHKVSFNGSLQQTMDCPGCATGIGFYDFEVAQDGSTKLVANPAITVTHHLEIATGELELNANSSVHNGANDASAHLGASGKLALTGSVVLAVDVWSSNGGAIIGADRLQVGKVSAMTVDDGFDTGTPGFGIDHFATIGDALSKSWLGNGATVTIKAGTYNESLTVSNPVHLVADGSITLNTLTLNHAGADFTAPGSSLTFTLNGDLTVTAGAFIDNGGLLVLDGNATHTLSSGLTLNNLTIWTGSTLTAPAALTLKGHLTNQGTLSGSGSLTVAGNLANSGTLSGAAINLTFDNPSAATQHNLGGAGTMVLNNLTLPDGEALALSNSSTLSLKGSLGITGALTAGTGSTLDLSSGAVQTLPTGLTLWNLSITSPTTFTAPAALSLIGNLTNQGTFNAAANSSTVNLIGSGTQNITGNAILFYNLTIDDANDAGGANEVQSSAAVNVDYLLNISDGKFSPSACGQYAAVTIGANGEFAPQTNGSCAQKVSGSWTNNGVFTAGTSKVAFNGAGSQTIGGSVDTTFNNLEIANTSSPVQPVAFGTGRLAIVNGTLTMTGGEFQPTTGSQLHDVSIQGGKLKAPAGALDVSGSWTNQATAGAFDANNGVVRFIGSGSHALSGPAQFSGLEAANGNPLALDDSADVTVTGALNLGTGGIGGTPGSKLFLNGNGPASLPDHTLLGSLKIGPAVLFNAPDHLTLGGGLTNLGTFNAGTGTVTFDGSGTPALEGNVTFYDLAVDNGTLTSGSGSTLTVTNSLTASPDGNIDGSASGATFVAAGPGIALPDGMKLNHLIINEGASVSAPGALTLFGDLTTNGPFDNTGGSTTFDGGSPTTHNVSGSGAVTFGDLNIAANSTLKPAAAKSIAVKGNWDNDGAFDANGGTVVFNGTTNQAIGGANNTIFGSLTVDNSGTPGAVSMADGRSLTVQNDLLVTGGDFRPSNGSSFKNVSITNPGQLSPASGASISVSGDWSDNPGGSSHFTPNSGAVVFTGPGQQLFRGNTLFADLQVNNGSTLVLDDNADLGYRGEFTLAAGEPGGALDAVSNPGATLTLAGPGTQTLPDGLTLDNLTVATGAVLDGANTSVTLLGNLTANGNVNNGLNASFNGSGSQDISGTGAVHLGNVVIGPDSILVPAATLNGNTLYVGGDWTNHNPEGGFTSGTGTVAYEGTGSHTLGGERVTSFNNLNVLGGSLDGPAAASGTTTIADGAAFEPANGSTFNNITIQPGSGGTHGGTLQPASGAAISISGDWTDDSSAPNGFAPNGGTLILNGTTGQTIGGSRSPATFNNLVITGPGTVDPSVPLQVSGDLTMDEGAGTLLVPNNSTFHNVAINPSSTFQLDSGAQFAVDGSWSNQGSYDANGGGLASGSAPLIATATVDKNTCMATPAACGVDRFATIQEAIDNVTSDGVVNILNNAAGSYGSAATDTLVIPAGTRMVLSFQGTDPFTILGNIVQGSGTIMAPNGTLTLDGSYTHTGGSFNANNSTVTLAGSAVQQISGSEISFYNLTIDDADDATGTNDVQSSAVVNVTHLLAVADGKFSPSACGQYAAVTIGANGEFAPQTNGACAQKVSGGWTNNGVFTAGTSKVAFNGLGAQAIAGGVDTVFNDLTVDTLDNPSPVEAGEVVFTAPRKAIVSGELEVLHGTFQPTDGSSFKNITIGTEGTLKPASGAGITISGSWNNTGVFTHNSGTVTLTSPSAETDQVLNGNLHFYNLVVNEPSAATRVDANGAVSVENDLTLTQGVFQFATGAAFKNLIVAANGTLEPDLSASFSVSGDWTNLGVYTPNQDTVIFDGSGDQYIQGLPTDSDHPFYNLTVANTANPQPACATAPACNAFYDNNQVHFDLPIMVANQVAVEDGQFSPMAGSTFKDIAIRIQGRLRAQSSPSGSLTVTGRLLNEGLFDLNSLTAAGSFALDQVYVSSEYDANTPGYGVDHFNRIQGPGALNAPGLRDGAKVIVYGGDYPGDVTIDKNVTLEMVSKSAIDLLTNLPVKIAGSLTLNHAQATVKAPLGELQIGGGFTLTQGVFTRGTGTVTFNGDGTQHIVGGPHFYDLKIDNQSNPTGDDADVDADAALAVDHLLTVNDGQFSPLPCSSFGGVVIGANGVLEPQAATAGCNSGLQISGDWTNSGGSFSPNGSRVAFTGGNPQSVTGEGGFGDVTIGNGAGVTLGSGVELHDLTILPSGQVNQLAGASLTVNGSWDDQNPNGGLNATDGTVTFAGTSSHAYTGITTFPNLTVGAGSTLVLGDSSDLRFTGSLAVTGSLDATSNPGTTVTVAHSASSPATQTLTGTTLTLNDLVIDAGSTLSGAGQNLTLVGDFTNNGTFNGGNGAVNFNGSGDPLYPQHILGTGDTNFNDLNISNPVVATDQADVAGTLTIQSNGNFQPGNQSTLHNVTIDAGGTLEAPAGTSGQPSNLNVTGNWNNSGTYDPSTDGTVTFNGSGPQSLSGTNHFDNLVINNPGNAVTLNNPVTVDGTLNVDHGQFVQVQNGSSFDTIQVGANGNLIAIDNATNINANHLDIAPGTFSAPGGIFAPSNVLWDTDGGVSTTSVAEKPIGLNAGDLVAVDLNQEPQTAFIYALANDAAACGLTNDNGLFTLATASGRTSIKTSQALDFETHPQPYTLCVKVTDPSERFTIKKLTVTPTDANDEPVVALNTLSVDEDSGVAALTITASDQDATLPHTLSWNTINPAGITHGIFSAAAIQNGNTFSFSYDPNVPNWSGSQDTFTVKVTDGTATTDVTVHVNVLPVNDPPINEVRPTVSPTSPRIDEKAQATSGNWNDNADFLAPGSINLTYQWQSASDASGADAAPIPGAVESAYYPTAADQGRYLRVEVTAHDNGYGLPASQSATAYSDWTLVPGEAPTDITLSHYTVAEKQPAGTLVGTLQGVDRDNGDVFTFALVSGNGSDDNNQFEIAGGNKLITTAVFDYATKSAYTILVQATDGGSNPYTRTLEISIVGLQAEVQPRSEVTLDYAATELNPTETNIEIPYGAVLDPMTLLFVPRQTVDTVPEGQHFANHAFDLTAIIAGQENKNYELNKPFTFTLTYPDAAVQGISENTLKLKVWSGSAWENAACGDAILDPEANRLSVPVCRLGEFALFGNPQHLFYLPIVRR